MGRVMEIDKFERHNIEIHKNREYWDCKPILQTIYADFYQKITAHIRLDIPGKIVELGSGIGNLKKSVPNCICTDVFTNPWIEQVENAYKLSFEDESVSHLILFDVWHHLQYPGCALEEFNRVLHPHGRIIIFEPYISLLGAVVYGLFHKEDVAWRKKISLQREISDAEMTGYYAAQGNATRIFCSSKYKSLLAGYTIADVRKESALAYVLSGGYSGTQLYPDKFYRVIKYIEKVANKFPRLLATRTLIVLEKQH